jgi:hypothetical protein
MKMMDFKKLKANSITMKRPDNSLPIGTSPEPAHTAATNALTAISVNNAALRLAQPI